MQPIAGTGRYRLGRYVVDLNSGETADGDSVVELSYKSRQALRLLIEANGEVVRRETLFQHLWDGLAVDESSLTKCMGQIRHALGNSTEGNEYLETVPRVGYRLRVPAIPLAEVGADSIAESPAGFAAAESSPSKQVQPAKRKVPGWRLALAAGVALAATGGWIAYSGWREKQERIEQAHKLFEEGERLSRRRDPQSSSNAVRLFEQAVALNPNGRWYAHLARAAMRANNTVDGKQPLAALEAAKKSVELDPACMGCQLVYGFTLFYHAWQWPEAERHLMIADRMAPQDPDVGAHLAMYFATQSRLAEALDRADLATTKRPYQPTWHAVRASVLYFLGRNEEAIAAADRGIGLDQNNVAAWDWRSRALWESNRRFESLMSMVQGRYAQHNEAVEAARARGGVEEGFRELLRLTGDYSTRRAVHWRRAVWMAQLGDTEGALADLELGVELRNVNMVWIAVDPAFRHLRSQPRFIRILEQMGLAGPLSASRAPK